MPYPDNFNARLFDEFHDAPEPKGPDAAEQSDINVIKGFMEALLALTVIVEEWRPHTGLGRDAKNMLINYIDDAGANLASERKRLEA